MESEDHGRRVIRDLAERHPVAIYLLLTFVLSWGGFFLAGAPGLLAGTNWQEDPRFGLAVLAMLAGPPVAGIVSTLLLSGPAGLRALLDRLLRWRVAGRWYVVALLTAPLVQLATLFSLSAISPRFLPGILRTEDPADLLITAVVVGIVGGLVEETGWTGFAVPRLRQKHGITATGILIGVVWGVWHLLQMWWVGATSTDAISPSLFLPLYFLTSIATLAAFRVLMVWVYDGTGSLLVAVLMHASYIFTTLFVFAPPTTGEPFLIYSGVFVGALWSLVAIVSTVRRHDSQERSWRTIGNPPVLRRRFAQSKRADRE